MIKEIRKIRWQTFAGCLFIVVAFVMACLLDAPTMREKAFQFDCNYNGKTTSLSVSYYGVEGASYAVLICPGYSCDRQKWRPMADLCVSNGYSTMLFDYSGQAASDGTIGFDNAKTDCIPTQIDAAIEELHRLSGVDYENIILMGHSMGGRSILRLLYDYNNPTAVTTVQKKNIGQIILISPEVNYEYNAQASLFAGTSDAFEDPWKDYGPEDIKGTDVYLAGSTADDIVSWKDGLALFSHLMGTAQSDTQEQLIKKRYDYDEINGLGSRIKLHITSGVLHSYQMYSSKFGRFVNDALTDISGEKATYPSWSFAICYGEWLFGLIGLGLFLYGLNKDLSWTNTDNIPHLIDSNVYLKRKALLWLPGTLVAFVICCICVIMPFGSPVMNTPYMCFIAGYGLVMLFAYRKGNFKGSEGKLPAIIKNKDGKKKIFENVDRVSLLKAFAVTFVLCFFVWTVLRSTMYRLIPLNIRWFWLIFATVLMSVGYYVSGVEADMFDEFGLDQKHRLIYQMIQYVPLFLLVAFYLVIGSYSGMIGQAQNMVLMYIFCIPIGNYVKKLLKNRVIGAVLTAFLFQTLMITSAALISMF